VGRLREFWWLIREGVEEFFEDAAHSRGAAISFYAMTAMGPVLYIGAWVAGIFLGSKAAHTHLLDEIRRVVGYDTATMLQAAITAAGHIRGGWLGTLAGVLVLVFTAGSVFVEVQSALNCIWKTPSPPFTWWGAVKSYLLSLALVGGLGLLLCVSLMVNTLVGAFGRYFEALIGIDGGFVWLLNTAVSASLITFLFAAVYRVLPNRPLEWRDVIAGAVITAVLILVGEYVIAFYLAETALSHRYGTAGGAMAILIWLYYSAQVFLLGAEITKVWSLRHGSPAAKAVAHEIRQAA
jgi:membrane protein